MKKRFLQYLNHVKIKSSYFFIDHCGITFILNMFEYLYIQIITIFFDFSISVILKLNNNNFIIKNT